MVTKEDCFHLGVKGLIRNIRGEVLLLERRRNSEETYWDIPGGRLERGETLLETLQRELEEEIGFKKAIKARPVCTCLTDIRVPTTDGDVGLIFSIYLCHVTFRFTPQLSHEHINYEWLTFGEAIQRLTPEYPLQLITQLKSIAKAERIDRV